MSDGEQGPDPTASTRGVEPRAGDAEREQTVPRGIVAECGVPNIVIDFTEASCAHPEVTVEASCRWGASS